MLEYFKQILSNQLNTSLTMLEQCIAECPPEHWNGMIGTCAFWHVAHHALTYADLYLSQDEASYNPPSFASGVKHYLDKSRWSPEEQAEAEVIYSQDVLKQYAADCKQKAITTIAAETEESLKNPSGFPWYPMSRGEHHLCNIRHIQHHTGQLTAYLRRQTDVEIMWTK